MTNLVLPSFWYALRLCRVCVAFPIVLSLFSVSECGTDRDSTIGTYSVLPTLHPGASFILVVGGLMFLGHKRWRSSLFVII